MIVWRGQGNLLLDHGWTQLCPVNIVGVMGRGLAKSMADAYPGLLNAYQSRYDGQYLCARQLYHLTELAEPVLLFPTKYHWRNPSDIDLVEDNLRLLGQDWQVLGITRLAMPLPGTGLGRLPRAVVEEMVGDYLGEACELPVRLYL